MTEDADGPLTDVELRDFLRLLGRFAEYELDQFENWRIPTSYGSVYLAMTRSLWPGFPEEAFDPVSLPPDDSR